VLLSINNTAVNTVGEFENGIRAAQTAGRTAVGVQWMRPGQPPIYVGIRLR
jgi:serine protease Do